ncbi:MAG: gas vesicle protein GvpJ [Burkholderiales bacterium]
MSRRPTLSTVSREHPPKRRATPPPPRSATPPSPAPRQVARIIDQSDSSLLDVLDNLLNRGVVLNAEIVLALANVDLVYLRISALLCAADRLLPHDERRRS